MRVRECGYCDYGFAPGEEKQLLAFCRGSDFAEDFLLLECAKKSNPAICADIYYSLVRGLSWEQLDKRATQLYGKPDFYAYRRRTLGLFRAALIECGRYPIKGNVENGIEFLKDSDRATVSFSQGRYISRIKKLAAERPAECEFVAENTDGSICAHIPVSWVKINPTQQLSDERRQRMADVMNQNRQKSNDNQCETD